MWMTLLMFLGIFLLLWVFAYMCFYVGALAIVLIAILVVIELLGYGFLGWLGIDLPEVLVSDLIGAVEMLIVL